MGGHRIMLIKTDSPISGMPFQEASLRNFRRAASPPLPASSSSALTLLTNDPPGEHMPVLVENSGELAGGGGELRLMETDKHPGSGVHAALAAAHQTDVRRNRLLA